MIANRYQLLGKLGQGGMGAVYKAHDRLTNTTVALKQVLLAPSDLDFASRADTDTDLHLALAQEFRTLASLRHPNIISVLDYGFSENRQPFFTMNLLDNPQTIVQYSRNKSNEDKVRALVETLQALTYLHRRNIVHRDLKPDNILVTANEQIKVLDFGLSTASDQAKELAGTLVYMAPEILRGQPASRLSDLYTVGVLAYELFIGTLPFNENDSTELVVQILRNTPNITISNNPYLEMVLIRLLMKDPDDRYETAERVITELCAAVDIDPPQESIIIRESFLQTAPFVGRDAELTQLVIALDDATQGNGSSWLIGGESGIGKSRLLDEVRTHALVTGVTVFRGQGVDGGGLPYQLWRDMLRHLVLTVELNELEKQILKEIVPDIGTLLREDIMDAPLLDGKAKRERLVLTIVDVFKRQKQASLVILEDLQWAVESLEPLKHLNRFVHDLPLVIMANYRNDEKPDLPENLNDMEAITLSRLDDATITELSASMLGEAGTQPQVLDLLKRETEGNVFFMVEVVRALAEEAGRLSDIGRITLPQQIFAAGIQEIVRRRLKRVPIWGQEMLKIAAIAGRQLDAKILKRLATKSLQNQTWETWLQICNDASVLEIQNEQWRFNHDKLREILLFDLSDEERPDLHRQVAEAIEAVYPDDANYNEVLLEHWRSAGDLDKELWYLVLVAEHLVEITAAHNHARSLLDHGLQQLPEQDERRIGLLNWLALSNLYQSNYSQAKTIAQKMLLSAKQTDNEEDYAQSLRHLGNIARVQGHYVQSHDYLQHSLSIWQALGDQPQIARLLNYLADTLVRQEQYTQAQDCLEQSLAISQMIGDQVSSTRLFNSLAMLAVFRGDYAQAQDYLQRTLANHKKTGDRHSQAVSLNNLGYVADYQEHYAQAQDYLQRSLAIRQEIGDQQGSASTLTNLGFVLLKTHDEAAQQYLAKALALANAIHLLPTVLEALTGCAIIISQQGDVIRAAEIAGLVQNHPACSQDIIWRLGDLLPLLENTLSVEVYQTALEQGKSLDLDTVVQEILDEFGCETNE